MYTITIKGSSGIQKEVNVRKTLSGDFILREHPEIDIFIIPSKQKVLVLPKDEQTEHVFLLQERLFKYMVSKGVILPETVVAGNVYGSLQGGFPQEAPGGEDTLQVVIYSLSNFLDEEMPKFNAIKQYEEELEKELLNPSVEDSTEFGEVPQEPYKGSIPKYGFPTRGIYRYNY